MSHSSASLFLRFRVAWGIFCLGAISYATVEVLYKGSTHVSMVVTGGLCGLILYGISRRMRAGLLLKALVGGLAITAVELVVGCTVNLWLGLDVWSYETEAFHLLGQICPRFSLAWILLSIPGLCLCSLYRQHVVPCLLSHPRPHGPEGKDTLCQDFTERNS